MARPARAHVNLNAIIHNYRLSKAIAPGQSSVAIVKGNAYGHGAVAVAQALASEADALGVACIEEALELRDAGIRCPILLLEGFFSADELATISELSFWCAIHSVEQLIALEAKPLARPINVWLKMDSGMHRLGVSGPDFKHFYQRLKQLDWVNDIVLMSHFSSADELDNPESTTQWDYFEKHSQGIDADISLANSAATLARTIGPADNRRHWQRPGLMLYGATPFLDPQGNADQLQAAMTLSSEIIAIRDVAAGQAVGYGGTFVCKQPSRIATVAMGYADGYPRSAKSGTPVLVNGQGAALAGRVSMDMLSVDVTHLRDAKVGDRVELWGEQLAVSEVAKYCDTIPYTLLTGITRRVHSSYSQHAKQSELTSLAKAS